MSELLRCPFCGNKPLVDSCDDGGSSIRCRTFMCPLDDVEVSDDTIEGVSKRWNKRTAAPAQRTSIDLLAARKALDAIQAQCDEMRSLKGWRLNLIRENLAKAYAALSTPSTGGK